MTLKLIIYFIILIPIVFAIRIIAQILENKIYYMKDSPKKKLFKILFDVSAIIILIIVCAIGYYLRDSNEKADNTEGRGLVGDINIENIDISTGGRVGRDLESNHVEIYISGEKHQKELINEIVDKVIKKEQ